MNRIERNGVGVSRIDVHHLFELVCWARHFGVAQAKVKEAVAAVGPQVSAVAAFLRPI